jgi:hypothetical protein
MTLIPDTYDFTIWQGASFYETLTVYSDAGTTIRNLSNCTVTMNVTKQPKGDLLIALSTSNGKITLDGPNGIIRLALSASDTSNIQWKRGYYEISIVDNGNNITDIIMYGNITVEK